MFSFPTIGCSHLHKLVYLLILQHKCPVCLPCSVVHGDAEHVRARDHVLVLRPVRPGAVRPSIPLVEEVPHNVATRTYMLDLSK